MQIIDSKYNKGFSSVTIQTPIGHFTGKAYLHPDDKEIGTCYTGWRIAEQRALIKYYKAHIRKEKNIIKGIIEFYDYFPSQDNVEVYENLYYQHTNQIKDWKRKIQENLDNIKNIEDTIEQRKKQKQNKIN